MLYVCEVWGFKNIDILENLHIEFLKYTLKVKMTTYNNMVYRELGRCAICVAVQNRIIGFWGRLLEDREIKFTG